MQYDGIELLEFLSPTQKQPLLEEEKTAMCEKIWKSRPLFWINFKHSWERHQK
jgi:hypothetical protein